MRPGAQPDLSEARAWVPHAETSYLTMNNPQGRRGAALYLAVSLNGFLTSVCPARTSYVCDATMLAQCAPKRHRRTANISPLISALGDGSSSPPLAAPPIPRSPSLPLPTPPPHRPWVRAFGTRAIEPVGSLSGLSGAAAG